MLICIRYQHLTKEKTENKDFDDVDVDEKRKTKDERRKTSIEKEQKKVKIKSKQMCVSSQTKNVRRWRHRSGYTYLLFGEIVRACLVRAERAAILHGDFTGKTHKIPQMSY